MARTEVYVFRTDGFAEKYGEVLNAWRGGWAVWISLEKKYLPSMPKPYADMRDGYFSRFFYATIDDKYTDVTKEVWRLANSDSPLTENERTVMISTFDWTVVKREHIPKLISAYRNFDVAATTLKEQADILSQILADSKCNDVIAVAFTQTTIVDGWDEIGDGWDEIGELDSRKPYNILTGDRHFWLFEDEVTNE